MTSAEYQDQVNAIYAALGKFINNFQFLCLSMEDTLWRMLHHSGLQEKALLDAMLVNATAYQLLQFLEAIFAEKFKDTPHALEKEYADQIFNRIQKVINMRNSIDHGLYFIGWGNESTVDFSNADAYKMRSTRKKGLHAISLPGNKETLEGYADYIEELAKILRRVPHYAVKPPHKRNIEEDTEIKPFLDKSMTIT